MDVLAFKALQDVCSVWSFRKLLYCQILLIRFSEHHELKLLWEARNHDRAWQSLA